jgi:Raf kinase inhibitor-like YbhB/YbcL family protein
MKINRGTLALGSPAFEHGGPIPFAHSSRGSGVSPALRWEGVPEGTRSFALLVHDPDAPVIDGWTHWVLSGIPAGTTSIPEGGGLEYRQGINSRGETGWTPVGPPPGHGRHHYVFHLYALDADPVLPDRLTGAAMLDLIEPLVINQARVVGTYSN